jgi:hypothetical protein
MTLIDIAEVSRTAENTNPMQGEAFKMVVKPNHLEGAAYAGRDKRRAFTDGGVGAFELRSCRRCLGHAESHNR